jgi:lysophospholipase L1-like esterase
MPRRCAIVIGLLLLCAGLLPGQDASLPRVVLIGDSIRLGYAPGVAKLLEGKAVIISPKQNGGDSSNVLKNLEAWVIQEKPDLVHINAGLHDLKHTKKTNTHQVPLPDYEKNLKAIVDRLQKQTRAKIIFATTTPILDERHAQRKAAFDRFEADVKKYNAAARAVMQQAKVPINDLHQVVVEGGPADLLGGDGTHYTPSGNARLAAAVAASIQKHLKP